ncbi:MAG: hypothetical protein ACKVI8_14865, partial [Paraglaciecola sp.]
QLKRLASPQTRFPRLAITKNKKAPTDNVELIKNIEGQCAREYELLGSAPSMEFVARPAIHGRSFSQMLLRS